MIGWLNGQKIDTWAIGSKKGALICCGGIGYEVQLIPRDEEILKSKKDLTLWIHQIFREDTTILFGFRKKSERDLFRKIIEINGIGPQIAISLLNKYEFDELIIAIKTRDISKLSKASGIGKRIAERLSIELKDKLMDFSDIKNNLEYEKDLIEKVPLHQNIERELHSILISLNYNDSEITKALKTLSTEITANAKKSKLTLSEPIQEDIDWYLKKALILLSQEISSKGT